MELSMEKTLDESKTQESLPQGLTSAEVEAMKAEGKVNVTREKVGKSYFRIITDNLVTFFNFVWALVAVVLIIFNSYSNLTFLAVIIPNVLIAIVLEIRAKRAVGKLSQRSQRLRWCVTASLW